ncbi:molybdopterin cofactor-binding domain-containing protein [Dongia sp.]|uniref:xanthine dehydrogenase family protein molybdopterin-binding subunit n=1 Tax=Dongia sp. TaxID=1977262 RepID=UPI0037538D6B
MNDPMVNQLSRRSLLAGTGAVIVSFSLVGRGMAQEAPKLPGSLANDAQLDSWIRIDGDGAITVFTGKAELGQGVKTALIQVAAEELEVAPAEITLVTADTGRTPNEGYTAGSQSMPNSGTAIRNAAAQVRALLVAEAARRQNVAPETQKPAGKKIGPFTYGELAAAINLHVAAQPDAPLKSNADFKVMGRPFPRADIPAKVTGGVAYVQDLRPGGMLHARVVRAPSPGAAIASLDASKVKTMPGVKAVVQDGNFLAVVAEGEFQAVQAMRALAAAVQWNETAGLPAMSDLPAFLKSLEREVGTVAQEGSVVTPAGDRIFKARFTRPYMMHGSIGPSCAIAVMDGDMLTIWSHTQGVYPDRKAIAEMLALPPENVRIIHAQGAGCYGHNGADDAAADAAVIGHALPGQPIRVQWMREQEHANEPYGPAMLMEVEAALAADGTISTWNHDVWTNTHSTRPGGAGALLAGRSIAKAFPPEPAELEISPAGNGDRNANPLYSFANRRILWHFLPEMPLRVSALRSLGAYANVFALESFMDDMALQANADPVAFRLKHLDDQRAKAVIEEAAAKFGWAQRQKLPGQGHGFAFARYKNHAAYLALAVTVAVDRDSGHVRLVRAVAAIDSGEIVNPDGIRNQTEGGILQAMSWTLYEQVTFDQTHITSIDWASYPILRFGSVPDAIEVHIIPRPNEPFLGTGEAAQGPTPAAIRNAIRDASGVRLYDLPFSRDRVRAAIGI